MSLRGKVVAEMLRHEAEQLAFREGLNIGRKSYAEYCTWWFKHKAGIAPKDARRELLKMEREGLVTADRSQSNNTKWLMVEPPQEVRRDEPAPL